MFSATTLLLLASGYVLLFYAVAFITQRGWVPKRFARHPYIYVLSLGVYTSSWTIFACIDYAYRYGYNFLTFFLGVSGLFLLAALLLMPILRLTRTHQLASIADLFAFRYHSRAVGSLTTVLLLLAVLPLMSLQIKSMSQAVSILTDEENTLITSLVFCGFVLVCAILLGSRQSFRRQKNEGLVVAIALESFIKITAFAAIALFGYFGVLHGPSGFSEWLQAHPELIDNMYQPLQNGTWHSLIVAFLVAAIVMPHMFHMVFTENLNPNTLNTAVWGLPLMMLIIALCVPFILWAALEVGASTSPDFFVLGLGLATHPGIALLGFIAGLASTVGMLVVSLLALSSMCLNHLVLPFINNPRNDLYHLLTFLKRVLIAVILVATWFAYTLMSQNSLMDLGSLSYVAALQFVPALGGLILWPGANRYGVMAGILVGFVIWAVTLLGPSLGLYSYENVFWQLLHFDDSDPLQQRYSIATISLAANVLTLIVISLITASSPEEQQAAEACVLNSSRRSFRLLLKANTVDDFQQALAAPLGEKFAQREVNLALTDLNLKATETRPYALRRLRDQLESNLSGMLGPSVAGRLVSTYLPYRKSQHLHAEDTQLIENRIEQYRNQLSGLAAELDSMRRFHRQTLLELPIGVISLSDDGEVVGWNRAIEMLSHINSRDIIGARLDSLPSPWKEVLHQFYQQPSHHLPKCELNDGHQVRWLSLHKSRIQSTSHKSASNGWVIVVEDVTERNLLESRLAHNERLASIGRLAAGVAHEIGNPVTAISCLAQNLEYVANDLSPDDIQQARQQIIEQTERITRIVESLVTFSHSGQLKSGNLYLPVTLHTTINEAIHLLQMDARYQHYRFINQTNPLHQALGDPQRLLQVFINLLSNAADASQPDQPITLSSRLQNGNIQVDVEDYGQGIDPELLDHLFEPFVTSKAPGRGTGLGLALIYSIMEEHNGSISAVSPAKSGASTCFTLTLPIYDTTDGTTDGTTDDDTTAAH